MILSLILKERDDSDQQSLEVTKEDKYAVKTPHFEKLCAEKNPDQFILLEKKLGLKKNETLSLEDRFRRLLRLCAEQQEELSTKSASLVERENRIEVLTNTLEELEQNNERQRKHAASFECGESELQQELVTRTQQLLETESRATDLYNEGQKTKINLAKLSGKYARQRFKMRKLEKIVELAKLYRRRADVQIKSLFSKCIEIEDQLELEKERSSLLKYELMDHQKSRAIDCKQTELFLAPLTDKAKLNEALGLIMKKRDCTLNLPHRVKNYKSLSQANLRPSRVAERRLQGNETKKHEANDSNVSTMQESTGNSSSFLSFSEVLAQDAKRDSKGSTNISTDIDSQEDDFLHQRLENI